MEDSVVAGLLIALLFNLGFVAATLAGIALLPLLVMAVLRPTRALAGRGITVVSWVEGVAIWIVSAIAIRTGYGTKAVLLGLGLTAVAALGATAARLRTWGILASLLPMAIVLMVKGDFSERQFFIWTLWVVAILPLHFLGRWISAEPETG